MDLMVRVAKESRRVLKPTGSAVFILQPNSARLGRMRPWLWEWLVWLCREWNIVQDVYWWSITTMPANFKGLLRPSVKYCVWAGSPDCYRNQDTVLWTESQRNAQQRLSERCNAGRILLPSGHSVDDAKCRAKAVERGGVTPFNCLPIPGANLHHTKGHPAATPPALCDWWLRYITRPGETVLDPFAGGGTVGESATKLGRRYIGIERYTPYLKIAEDRLSVSHVPAPVTLK